MKRAKEAKDINRKGGKFVIRLYQRTCINKHTKSCSIVVIREKHIKTTVRFSYVPIRMAKMKKDNARCG